MNMTDNEIREFFHSNRPSPTDGTSYMAGLSSRMQEIEEIKAIHDASVRRNRHALVISFIAGLVIGAGVLALLLFKPDFIQLPPKAMIASATIFLDKFKLLICLLIAVVSVLLSLIPLRSRE